MATVPQSGANSKGFFGDIFQSLPGLDVGLRKITEEVFPRWVSEELDLQQNDRLFQPTLNRALLPTALKTGTGTTATATVRKAGLLFDNINVSSGGLLIAGAALIAVVLLIRAR